MNVETWASVGVSLATGVCGAWAARAARRTPRQEKRDDFTAITDRLNGEIERHAKLIDLLQRRADQAEERADHADRRLEGAMAAVAYLIDRVRGLSGYIRSTGMEPPAAAPIPTAAREFINNDM
ncbi:hypothetical protein AB0D97_12400 [Streptomyces roseus]|uniref:hypothetical protein n=1 Tax=Streptomyces roseus TaxID=66430 RepID=UPI0033F87A98